MIWQVEVCQVCGMQLTPCPQSNMPDSGGTGRCAVAAHRSRGGTIITIKLPDDYAADAAGRVNWDDWERKHPTISLRPSNRPNNPEPGDE